MSIRLVKFTAIGFVDQSNKPPEKKKEKQEISNQNKTISSKNEVITMDEHENRVISKKIRNDIDI